MSPAERLTLALGGAWHGSYGTARCPGPGHERGDHHASLSVRDGEKSPLVTCHAGRCGRLAIIDELRRRELWPDAREPLARPPAASASDRNREWALRIWGESAALARSPGARYLAGRGITLPPPPSLRWHRGLKHKPTGLTLPAMVAAVQAPDRATCAVQRTFLTADGVHKAPVSEAKMTLGPMGSGAVRLATAAETLGIAEGIETALSAMQLTGLPTWAVLGAERLGKLALPAEVRHVVIFADRGAEMQAERARAIYERKGLQPEIRYPAAGFQDFNDEMTGKRT